MFLDGAKLHQPGRILLPVSSSRTGRPIARSAEELSSTWPSPADITVDLDHRPNWTERIVALRLRPTVGDLRLRGTVHVGRSPVPGQLRVEHRTQPMQRGATGRTAAGRAGPAGQRRCPARPAAGPRRTRTPPPDGMAGPFGAG